MIFEVKKDKLFSIIFYSLIAFLFGLILFVLFNTSITNKWIGIFISILILLLLVWIWYGSNYKINNTVLNIEFGPFKKNIPIRTIKKIELNRNMWVGYKLGLSTGGIVIHYNDFDEVYISPENQLKFCNSLKRIHSKIELEENKN